MSSNAPEIKRYGKLDGVKAKLNFNLLNLNQAILFAGVLRHVWNWNMDECL